MSHPRDCEHGHQWGKCDICDLLEEQRENDTLRANIEVLTEALERLAGCDWVITLPDRMDAVRAIAREALAKVREVE